MTAGMTAGMTARRSCRIATLALAAFVASSGCATIIAGGPDEIPIRTNPPGAYVYVDGQVVGQTPMIVTLDRKRSLGDIRIYYPGFMPVQVRRDKSFNVWTLGNFFIGIFPIVVDFITGDWEAFDDDEIALGLMPGQAPPPYGVPPQMPAGPMQPMQPMPPQDPRPPQPSY